MKRAERMQDGSSNLPASTKSILSLPDEEGSKELNRMLLMGALLGIDWCGKQVETNRVVS